MAAARALSTLERGLGHFVEFAAQRELAREDREWCLCSMFV